MSDPSDTAPPPLSAGTSLAEDASADRRFVEQRAGWIVEKDGRPIAELEHVIAVGIWNLFRVKGGVILPELRKLLDRRSDRAAASALSFRNRADPTLIVPGCQFEPRLEEDDFVALDEMRERYKPPGALRAILRALGRTWDVLTSGPAIPAAPEPPPDPKEIRRYAEHDAGWLVEKEGRVLAELVYVLPDWPWLLYRVRGGRVSDEAKSALVAAARSEPGHTTIFRNRAYPEVVLPDGQFLASFADEGVVGLRDWRPL